MARTQAAQAHLVYAQAHLVYAQAHLVYAQAHLVYEQAQSRPQCWTSKKTGEWRQTQRSVTNHTRTCRNLRQSCNWHISVASLVSRNRDWGCINWEVHWGLARKLSWLFRRSLRLQDVACRGLKKIKDKEAKVRQQIYSVTSFGINSTIQKSEIRILR